MCAARQPVNNNNLPSSVILMPSQLQAAGGLNNNVYTSTHSTYTSTTSSAFTFSAPTQSAPISSSHQFIPPPAPHGIFMQQHIGAPGVGVSWQHTVPKKMPWSESSALHFTSTTVTSEPRVSCRSSTSAGTSGCSTHKHKRHHVTFDEECPPTKRFLSEERMAISMENLYIGNMPAHLSGKDNSNTTDSWEKFLQLEERLKDDDIIDEEARFEEKVKNAAKFKISDEVKESLFAPEPLLPPQIMESLNKKSLEVVIWKPPEGVVSEIIGKVKKSDKSAQKSCLPGFSDNEINQSLVNRNRIYSFKQNDLTNDMDVDTCLFDSIDDDMML